MKVLMKIKLTVVINPVLESLLYDYSEENKLLLLESFYSLYTEIYKQTINLEASEETFRFQLYSKLQEIAIIRFCAFLTSYSNIDFSVSNAYELEISGYDYKTGITTTYQIFVPIGIK